MQLEASLIEIVHQTGPYALVVLFGASLIEYVFPPFPGDTVTIFGAFYAVQGELPLVAVFLAVTAGSAVGASIDYWVGRRIGSAAERRLPEQPRRSWRPSLQRLHQVEAAYRRHGDLYILINRFLPGVRGFFFVAAGMAGMPFRRVLGLGVLSAALWNALLLGVGFAVGENLDRLIQLFRAYSTIAWGALVAAALLWALRIWQKRRRAARADERGR